MTIGSQNKQPDSYLTYHADGSASSFVGRDAVSLFAAAALQSALGLYAKTGMMVNRAYTPSAMLAAASRTTGKTYKRGQYQQAADDLKVWCDAMKAALPVVEG